MVSSRNACLIAARYSGLTQLVVGLCSVDMSELILLRVVLYNLTKICYRQN